jgi:hypothetical protein
LKPHDVGDGVEEYVRFNHHELRFFRVSGRLAMAYISTRTPYTPRLIVCYRQSSRLVYLVGTPEPPCLAPALFSWRVELWFGALEVLSLSHNVRRFKDITGL